MPQPVPGPQGAMLIRVGIHQLAHGRGLALPAYQSAGAAGLDLVAAVPETEPLVLRPMARALVPTGIVLELPAGIEAQVRPRSGLALRHGITVLNSPGTIDSDYRGELMVLLINFGDKAWTIERGERIAQIVIQRVEQAKLVVVSDVGSTARGAGGFGSTGTTGIASRSSNLSKTSSPPRSGAKRGRKPRT